jgi:hypothetical protein
LSKHEAESKISGSFFVTNLPPKYFHILIALFAIIVSVGSIDSVFGQAAPGVGFSHPEAETSRMPLKVKMNGFINTHPEEATLKTGEDSIRVINFSIGIYRETYQFEVVSLEAVDRARITPRALLEPADKRNVIFDVTGPGDLLSKIAQSEPGTPLAITGFLQQRERRMQVTDVEIIGLSK